MDSKEIYYHPTFFEDLSRRYLGINKLPFPLSTLERLTKYAKKGYYPCNGTLLTIANGIRGIPDINDPTNTLTFYPDGSPRFVRYD